MKDLRQLNGVRDISRLPAMTFVRTLEEFEGPRLAEFKSEKEETFLYHWCEREDRVARWMVFRTPPQDLAKYLVGETTLQQLIVKCRDSFVYLIDLDSDDAAHGTFFVPVESLPEDYIPTENSSYDPATAAADNLQDVFINDDLAIQKVWDVRRKFLQAYNFLALFGPHGNSTGLAGKRIRYRLKRGGGWVRHTLFSTFAQYVRTEESASMAEVAAASPGYVRFDVNSSIASDLRSAVVRYVDSQKAIDQKARRLFRWLRDEKEMSERTAKSEFRALCEMLDVKNEELLSHADLDTAVDIIKSYLNRLAYFATEEHHQTAMLVGLKRS